VGGSHRSLQLHVSASIGHHQVVLLPFSNSGSTQRGCLTSKHNCSPVVTYCIFSEVTIFIRIELLLSIKETKGSTDIFHALFLFIYLPHKLLLLSLVLISGIN